MTKSLPRYGEVSAPPRGWRSFAAKGFRPFFLLAALFAIGIVPFSVAMFLGVAPVATYLDPVSWHAHEMIFGFATAVVIGFLLTAVGNWTQRETLVGKPLLALALLWVLGRAAMAAGQLLPLGAAALIDLSFLPIAIAVLVRPVWASRSLRNLPLIAVLALLVGANAAVHFEALGILAPGSARRACLGSIDLVLIIVLIISGRVIPLFTRNATQLSSIRSIPALDVASVVAMAALALIDLCFPNTALAGVASAVTALLAAARAWHWGARHSLREPLLWVLHAGYAWLVIGLVLRAVHSFDPTVLRSLATHALTVGAIASLILGMMVRVALGHTGRPLRASPGMSLAFAAIHLAAVVRALVPLVAPSVYRESLIASGVLWTSAFVVFSWVYAPISIAPRVDGKPG